MCMSGPGQKSIEHMAAVMKKVGEEGGGVKYMVMEKELTGGGEHIMQHKDNAL